MKIEVKKTLKITRNIFLSLLSLLLIVVLFQNIYIRIDKNYIPNIFGFTYLNVLSDSMSLKFISNDLVISKNVNNISNLKVDDIITFREGQLLITHRIAQIDKKQQIIKTKGDANSVQDTYLIKPSDIISKYLFHIPKAGLIIAKLQDYTFLLILWIAVMAYVITKIIKEVKNIKANRLKQID